MPVDCRHLDLDQRFDSGLVSTSIDGLVDVASKLSQLGPQNLVHPSGALVGEGLVEAPLWHDAPLLDDVDNHVPLAAVGDRVRQKEGDQSAIGGLLRVAPVRLRDVVQEVVASLDLVPEEKVALAELEVVQFHFLGERNAHGIQAGEDPAPSRAPLVSDRLDLVDL